MTREELDAVLEIVRDLDPVWCECSECRDVAGAHGIALAATVEHLCDLLRARFADPPG